MADMDDDVAAPSIEISKIGTDFNYKHKLVYRNVVTFSLLHLAALYGIYLGLFRADIRTVLWGTFVTFAVGIGVTVGAHRLFTHRTFKAKPILRVLLLLLHTTAGQYSVYSWARDHRQHHKYSDTDADPHNARRGIFFSHIGWLLMRKHPLVIEKGKTIDLSDLQADPFVMAQRNYYFTFYFIFCLSIPIGVPVYFWNEDFINSLCYCYFLRYIVTLHITWSVNSFAHAWGMKPYDKNIVPVESKAVSFLALGEGWHNYHHTFPWDYRTGEYGSKFNKATDFIDFCHYLGLAYDLKSASPNMVKTRILRTGDGSHQTYGSKNDELNSRNLAKG